MTDPIYELHILHHGTSYVDLRVELRRHNIDGGRTRLWVGTIEKLCQIVELAELYVIAFENCDADELEIRDKLAHALFPER